MADQITVSVGASGNVCCHPDELDVGKSNGTVIIKWKMDNDATSKLYEVSNIEIKDNNGQFTGSSKDVGDGWKITDKNDNTEVYKYDITVKNKNDGVEITLDPTVRNGGRRQV